MNLSIKAALAATVCGFSLTTSAASYQFNFDSLPILAEANSAVVAGLRFDYAVFAPDLDMFGDPIPGSEHWQVDPFSPAVTVDDPSLWGRGAAPSPANALEAVFQPVLITFDADFDLMSFSTTLDNDVFGDDGTLPGFEDIAVQFFGPTGSLLGRLAVDQTTPGFLAKSGALSGAKSILLPAGAFYDDIAIEGNTAVTAVPELASPGVIAMGSSLVAGFCLRRKKVSLNSSFTVAPR
jgi:hypothetical protein